MEGSGLLWKEGKKSRDKNRHSVIRGKLRGSHIPGNIRELTGFSS